MSLTHLFSSLDIASAVDITLAAGRHVESGSFSRPRVSRCSLTAMPSPSAERNSEKPGMPYRKAECKYRTHNSAAWRIKVEKGKRDVEN